MQQAENGENPGRDSWMIDLIQEVDKLENSIPKTHTVQELASRIDIDLKLTQYMRQLDISQLIREEQYIEQLKILTQILAEIKRSYDNYICHIYSNEDWAKIDKSLVARLELLTYEAAYVANLASDVAERIELYPPLRVRRENRPLPENMMNFEPQNEQIEPENNEIKISNQDFLSLSQEFAKLSDVIKAMLLEIVEKSLTLNQRSRDNIFIKLKKFFVKTYKNSTMAPPFLMIPFLLLQYVGHYWCLWMLFPHIESDTLGGLLRFVEAQDNIIVAFFIKYTLVSIVKTVLGCMHGKEKLAELEDGVDYQSLQFVKSLVFNALFFNFYQEMARDRTWAALIVDTAPIEILSYIDELCYNLYKKMALVRLMLTRLSRRSWSAATMLKSSTIWLS